MGKFTHWYNQQNETTRAWLDKQSIWNDKDMAFSFATGIVFGIILGVVIW